MRESASEWVNVLPWLLPVTAAFAVAAIWARRPFARVIGTRPIVAAGILIALGIVAGATLTPLGGPGVSSTSGCDLTRIGLASLGDLRRLNDSALNILLFVPLGSALGLVSPGRALILLICAATGLPFAIEAIQLGLPALGRGCQSADVIDNLTGLVAGIAMGSMWGAVSRMIFRGGRPT